MSEPYDALIQIGDAKNLARTLRQTRPVVVVGCDETVLALERSVAADIAVAAFEPAVPEAAQ